MSASGSAATVAEREPTQVELLRGTLDELGETALRIKNLAGLCRSGVLGYVPAPSTDEEKDRPVPAGLLAITKETLEAAMADLAEAEGYLKQLQEHLGDLAK